MFTNAAARQGILIGFGRFEGIFKNIGHKKQWEVAKNGRSNILQLSSIHLSQEEKCAKWKIDNKQLPDLKKWRCYGRTWVEPKSIKVQYP